MKFNMIRNISAMFMGISAMVSFGTAHAAIFCYNEYSCETVCTVNKKGVLKCQEVCGTQTICEDDGNGGSGGTPTYCYYDDLSGETICPLQN